MASIVPEYVIGHLDPRITASMITLLQHYTGTDPLQIARVSTLATILVRYMDLNPTSKVGVYFNEVNSGTESKYIPRSIQVDLEAGVCNRVSFSPAGLFNFTLCVGC
jgi:hypothetical protein